MRGRGPQHTTQEKRVKEIEIARVKNADDGDPIEDSILPERTGRVVWARERDPAVDVIRCVGCVSHRPIERERWIIPTVLRVCC
jgi:hypothetical protein